MERKITIYIELKDKGLYPMPMNLSFICKLIDEAFKDQPVCVERISLKWVYED